MQHVGLALATAIASWLNSGLLWVGLKRQNLFVGGGKWLGWVTRLFLATALMSLALIFLVGPMQSWFDWGLMQRILHLVLAIGVGMIVYGACWYAMGLRPAHLRPNT